MGGLVPVRVRVRVRLRRTLMLRLQGGGVHSATATLDKKACEGSVGLGLRLGWRGESAQL